MEEIEIKNIEAKNLAISTKANLYISIYWMKGIYFAWTHTTKESAESYLHDMKADHKQIYKIEIDIPYK